MQPADPSPITRILIVEDEAIIARDLQRRLEKLGYEVVGIADSGEEALALAAATMPSLVLMDIIIQGPQDGVVTAGDLVQQMDVPVIFLTAHADQATIERAKRIRPYGYLVKPFEERELQTTIEVALYRHRSEAQARLLQQAMVSATTGIVVADARDPSYAITLCNPAFEQISGYTPDEIIGQSPELLFGPETDPALRAAFQRALVTQRQFRDTLICHRKDGRQFWNDLSLSIVRNGIGEATHFLLFHSDVTDRKQAEEALIHAQRMEAVGQLTGGIAHDFNNLLGVILGYAEIIQLGLAKDDPRLADIAQVIQAAESAGGLTRQLLGFARRQPAAAQPIDVNTCIADLVKLAERTIGTQIDVTVTLHPTPVLVKANAVQIEQVLLNLVVNARDAMPQGGHLHLGVTSVIERDTARAGEWVRITVTDTGVGMDPATVARMFEPYFTSKAEGRGTGLGLFTCYGIVRDAGGTISAQSALGQGTTMTVELPVHHDTPPEAETPPAKVEPLTGAHQVLVVDDNASLRSLTVRILQSAGWVVMQAQDGEEAIQYLNQFGAQLSLIVTDIVMPGLNGYEVAVHARASAPQARVILTTGHADAPGAADGEAPVYPLLWKPYTGADLLDAVNRVLESV